MNNPTGWNPPKDLSPTPGLVKFSELAIGDFFADPHRYPELVKISETQAAPVDAPDLISSYAPDYPVTRELPNPYLRVFGFLSAWPPEASLARSGLPPIGSGVSRMPSGRLRHD
jgi:hypothetical protein